MRRLRPFSLRRFARPLVALLPATVIIAAGCGGGSSAAASTSARPRVRDPAPGMTVTPKVGRPSSVLHFSFRGGRLTSGRHDDHLIAYALSIAGPPRRSCTWTRSLGVPVPRAQATVSVSVRPPSGGWCPGSYTAGVDEVSRPVCGPGRLCPMFVVVLGRLGRVHFRINA
jgi:hypothetical protein